MSSSAQASAATSQTASRPRRNQPSANGSAMATDQATMRGAPVTSGYCTPNIVQSTSFDIASAMADGISAIAPSQASARRQRSADSAGFAMRYAQASRKMPTATGVRPRHTACGGCAAVHSPHSHAGASTASHSTCGHCRSRITPTAAPMDQSISAAGQCSAM